jgi:hypothetical protein
MSLNKPGTEWWNSSLSDLNNLFKRLQGSTGHAMKQKMLHDTEGSLQSFYQARPDFRPNQPPSRGPAWPVSIEGDQLVLADTSEVYEMPLNTWRQFLTQLPQEERSTYERLLEASTPVAV